MTRVTIPITGLACSAGDRSPLERALSKVRGVAHAYVNPTTDTVYLEVEPDVFIAADAIRVLKAFGARDTRVSGSGQ